jgi:hypothetical protein
MVRFVALRGTRSRQGGSIEAGEVGSRNGRLRGAMGGMSFRCIYTPLLSMTIVPVSLLLVRMSQRSKGVTQGFQKLISSAFASFGLFVCLFFGMLMPH